MKILVTGSNGFIGKNLIAKLTELNHTIYAYDQASTTDDLDLYTKDCEFIYHLAGINRPQNPDDFLKGNFDVLDELLNYLKKHKNHAPIMLSSSIQAELDNNYGRSKKAAELLLIEYAHKRDVCVYIYRFPNVFGKWCKPNYNSVVATFMHQVAHGLPLQINAPDKMLQLVYIDDLVADCLTLLKLKEKQKSNYQSVNITHGISLQDLANVLMSFRQSRQNLMIPNMGDPLIKKLYATYLTYLPTDQFSYLLHMNQDNRGSFTEFIKTHAFGQVSVNISKSGITKGNHWHHTKNEKFLVVSGVGVIRFRHIHSDQIISYHVSGDRLEVVDIPPGYTHQIENLGSNDMVTIMWANELFDKDRPDTVFLEV